MGVLKIGVPRKNLGDTWGFLEDEGGPFLGG